MTAPCSFSLLTHLSCARCGQRHEADRLWNTCAACDGPLYARYDLTSPETVDRARTGRPRGIWKWHELMPAHAAHEIVSLGEGATPLLPVPRLAARAGFTHLFVKDESGNPAGSFKARGMSAAITRAKALGATSVAVPTAGNAGGAAAAYAARAGLACHVFMPADTPRVFKIECEAHGAEVTLVDGLIDACGKLVAEGRKTRGWFDLSTLKEPYRAEGKKTMGSELLEDLGGELPDVVVYPTGGGTGLVGMWKAFEEMEALGWVGRGKRPRMFAVQAEGCAPVIRAMEAGAAACERFESAATYASGLRVPRPFADTEVLAVLRESGGGAVAVPDAQIRRASLEVASREGIFCAPEGGAVWAGLLALLESGRVTRGERIVLFNTGTAYKYLD